MTPTEKTLAYLRARGIFYRPARGERPAEVGPHGTCEVVERWVPFPKPGHRKDLFGFCDILAVVVPGGTLAIQACAAASAATRLAKLDDEPRVKRALDAGWAVEVWAWAKGAACEPRRLPVSGSLAALPAPRVEPSSPRPGRRGQTRRAPAPGR